MQVVRCQRMPVRLVAAERPDGDHSCQQAFLRIDVRVPSVLAASWMTRTLHTLADSDPAGQPATTLVDEYLHLADPPPGHNDSQA
jgi:hypothetical protein